MAQPKLSQEKIDLIEKFRIQGHSTEDVARFAGVGHGTAAKYIRQNGMAKGEKGQPEEPEFHDAIRRILKKGPQSDIDLADLMDCSPRRIRAAIDEMKIRGVMLLEQHGKIDLAQGIHLPTGELTLPKSTGSDRSQDRTRSFGVCGDQHLCNRHSRIDVLNAAYDEYERRGITEVFNTGNWIDGEAKFNKTELIVPPGTR